MLDEATVLDSVKAGLNLREEIPGVLVGNYTQQELSQKNADQYTNLRYLITEWDYVYLTKDQFSEIKGLTAE